MACEYHNREDFRTAIYFHSGNLKFKPGFTEMSVESLLLDCLHPISYGLPA